VEVIMQSGMMRRIAALLAWKKLAALSRGTHAIARLDAQGTSREYVRAYPRRWSGWAGTLVACAVLIVITAGCGYQMAMGNKSISNKEITSQVRIGEWTKVDVRRTLGEPDRILYVAGDEEVWHYMYMTGKMITVLTVLDDPSTDAISFSIRFTREGIVKEKGYGRLKL
jgi:hypothetical protein